MDTPKEFKVRSLTFTLLTIVSVFSINITNAAKDYSISCNEVKIADDELIKIKKRRECRILREKVAEQPDGDNKENEIKRIDSILKTSEMKLGYEVDRAISHNLTLTKKNLEKIKENKKLSKEMKEDIKNLDMKQKKFAKDQMKKNQRFGEFHKRHFAETEAIRNDLEQKRYKIEKNRTKIDDNVMTINRNMQKVTALLMEETAIREKEIKEFSHDAADKFKELKHLISDRVKSVCNTKCNCNTGVGESADNY